MTAEIEEREIPPRGLRALLGVPDGARGLVVFSHGSGSGRLSPRNQRVAAALRQARFATLLLDLLAPHEEGDRALVFDIPALASRLGEAVRWARAAPDLAALPVGCFGASTGAAAALRVAAEFGSDVAAVVSRGGRPDLAGAALEAVTAPTLLIVGSLDTPVLGLNRAALERLRGEKALSVVPGAGHLFEEPGTLDAVVALATAWFARHLPTAASTPGPD